MGIFDNAIDAVNSITDSYRSKDGVLCNHGVTNTGKGVIGTIMDAAAIAVAGYNTVMAIRMADLQYDIAKDYLDIAKWWRNYYNEVYKPLENIELAEAWALEPETPEYDITIGRHRNYARIQYRGLADKVLQCSSAYCTGLRQALLKDVANAEAVTLAAISNMGYRSERAYVEARNAVRWERRREVLNRGRGMIANNINFSNMAYGIFGNLGAQAGASAAGAMRYLGYSFNRQDPQYPMTYISGGVGNTTDRVGMVGGTIEQAGSIDPRTGRTNRVPNYVPHTQPAVERSVGTWSSPVSGFITNSVTGEVRPATDAEMSR